MRETLYRPDPPGSQEQKTATTPEDDEVFTQEKLTEWMKTDEAKRQDAGQDELAKWLNEG